MNLTLSKVRGQCCDGASNMSGLRNSVARQINETLKLSKNLVHLVIMYPMFIPDITHSATSYEGTQSTSFDINDLELCAININF